MAIILALGIAVVAAGFVAAPLFFGVGRTASPLGAFKSRRAAIPPVIRITNSTGRASVPASPNW